jgi:hypothetical protein
MTSSFQPAGNGLKDLLGIYAGKVLLSRPKNGIQHIAPSECGQMWPLPSSLGWPPEICHFPDSSGKLSHWMGKVQSLFWIFREKYQGLEGYF